jgi:uncharacterized iron-regulated membrane protein
MYSVFICATAQWIVFTREIPSFAPGRGEILRVTEMPQPRRFSPRRFFWTVHQWVGIGLLVLLVPIAVSGALLTYHDEFDALLNPKRWTVSGPELALSPSQYMARVSAVTESNETIIGMRFPHSPGGPVIVMARQEVDPGSGRRPRLFSFYLDPPTGAVLDKVDFRASLFGFLHVFHENLTIPQYSGRQIVGWAGVGMLILSLTGIWLWWPRRGSLLSALKWRRAPHTSHNLHQTLGFWISIPLAVVSLTGIYLSFPQTARSFMSSIAPMQAPPQRTFAAAIVAKPGLTADEALRLAQVSEPSARPATLFLPTESSPRPAAEGRGDAKDAERGKAKDGGKAREGGKGRETGRSRDAAPSWRVQLRSGEELITVVVNDQTKEARRLPDPLAGNRAAQWIRWIHDGSRGGPVWQFIVFLTGVFPAIFAFTGILMWLRGRRARQQVTDAKATREEELVAAE